MDIRQITAAETWELRQQVMWPEKHIDYVKLQEDEQGIHYGGFENQELITVISLFSKGKQFQFRKFATLIRYQKQGFGGQLLQYVLVEAARMGAEIIWCHARTEKVAFYESFGLQRMEQPFTRDGKEYVRMSKYLVVSGK